MRKLIEEYGQVIMAFLAVLALVFILGPLGALIGSGVQGNVNSMVNGINGNIPQGGGGGPSYTYDVIATSESGKQLDKYTITYGVGSSNLIRPKAIDGYITPQSQMISWDEEHKTINFRYDLVDYALNVDLNGGSSQAAASIPRTYTVEDAPINLPTDIKRGEEIFMGYSGSGLNILKKDVTIPTGSTGNRTYIANFKKAEYITVSFDSRGGGNIESQQIIKGGSLTSLPTPSKTGYDFIGWFDGFNKVDETEIFDKDTQLVAKWKAKHLSRVVVHRSATSKTELKRSSIQYDFGQQVTIKGLSFNGYGKITDHVFTGNMDTSDIILEYSPITYQISYSLNGGTLTQQAPSEYTVESDDITIPDATRKGHTFNGWTDGKGVTNRKNYIIKKGSVGNLVLTAKYSANTYRLTFDANGGNCNESYRDLLYGQYLTGLPTPIREGYTFEGWFTEKDGGIYLDGNRKMSDTDTTIYAHWRGNRLTINYHLNGGTDVVGEGSFTLDSIARQDVFSYPEKLPSGGLIDLSSDKVIAPIGHSSSGYYNTESNGNGKHLDMTTQYSLSDLDSNILLRDSTVDIYAQWNANEYTLTYNANSGSGDDVVDTVTFGSTFKVKNNMFKRNGYRFIGWNTDRVGNGENWTAKIDANSTWDRAENITLFAQWGTTSGTMKSDNSWVTNEMMPAANIIFTNDDPRLTNPNVIHLGDVSLEQNGSINAYYENAKKTLVIYSAYPIKFNSNSSYMFTRFYNLSSITFDNIDTSNVLDMSGMFANLTYLKSINGLEKMDLQNTKYTKFMFNGVNSNNSEKIKLDLSNLSIPNVVDMRGMFKDVKMSQIKTPKNIRTDVVINSDQPHYDAITTITWYDETDSYRAYDAGTFPVGNENISHTLLDENLNAQQKFTIYYHLNMNGIASTTTQAVVKGQYYNLKGSDTFSYPGYTFIHWSDSPNGGTVYYANQLIRYNLDSDLHLYAQWQNSAPQPTKYLVSLNYSSSQGTCTGGGYYDAGSTVTITATPNPGYEFVQWSDGITYASRRIVVNSNITLSAQFRSKQTQTYYTVTLVCDTSKGRVEGGGTYSAGSTVTIKAIPNAGYKFIQWNDGNTEQVRNIDVNQNIHLTASFDVPTVQPTKYSVSLSSNISGADANLIGSGIYDPNDEVLIQAYYYSNYTFKEWRLLNDNGSSTYLSNSNPYRFNISKNMNIEAVFTPTVEVGKPNTLTVEVEPYGAGQIILDGYYTNSGKYGSGEIAKMQAVANQGYTFLGWFKKGSISSFPESTNNPFAHSVNSNETWIAKFSADKTYVLINGLEFNNKLQNLSSQYPIHSVNIVEDKKPTNATEITGLDLDGDGGVIGWYTTEWVNGKTISNVYISSQEYGQKVIANSDSKAMFASLRELKQIKVSKLDVSGVKSFSAMFLGTTYNTNGNYVTLDLSSWEIPENANISAMLSGTYDSNGSFNYGFTDIYLPKKIPSSVKTGSNVVFIDFDDLTTGGKVDYYNFPTGLAESHHIRAKYPYCSSI